MSFNVDAATTSSSDYWQGFLPTDVNYVTEYSQRIQSSNDDGVAEVGVIANIGVVKEPVGTDYFYEVVVNALGFANTRQGFHYSLFLDDIDIPSTLYYGDSQEVSNDEGIQITPPAPMCYYGCWYTQLYVSSNGFVVMTSEFPETIPSSWNTAPSTVPSSAEPNAVLAPFARDLNGGTIRWGRASGFEGQTYFWIVWDEMQNQVNSNTQTFAISFPMTAYVYPICFHFGQTTDDEPTVIGYEDQYGLHGQTSSKSPYFNTLRLDMTDANEMQLQRLKVSASKGIGNPTTIDGQSTIEMDGWYDAYPEGINVEDYDDSPSDDGSTLIEKLIPVVDSGLLATSILLPLVSAPAAAYVVPAITLYGVAKTGYDLISAFSPCEPDTFDADAGFGDYTAYCDHKTCDDVYGTSQRAVWDCMLSPKFRWRLHTQLDGGVPNDPFANDHYLTIKVEATYEDASSGEEDTVSTEIELKLDSPYSYGLNDGVSWFGRTCPDAHDYSFKPVDTPYGIGYHIDSAGSSDSGYDMMGWNVVDTYTVPSSGALKVSGQFRQTGLTTAYNLRAYVLDADDLHQVLGSKQILSSEDGSGWVERDVVIDELPVGKDVRIAIGRPDQTTVDYSLTAEWADVQVSLVPDQTVYTLRIVGDDGGTTSPAPGYYYFDEPTDVTVTAVPDEGYAFQYWGYHYGIHYDNLFENPATVTVSETDCWLQVFFIPTWSLSISVYGDVGGTTDPPPGLHEYWISNYATVTAIPYASYVFDHWTLNGDCFYQNPFTFMDSDGATLVAYFVGDPSVKKLEIWENYGGTSSPPPGDYWYETGTSVSIEAIPDQNHRLDYWSVWDGVTFTHYSKEKITVIMNTDMIAIPEWEWFTSGGGGGPPEPELTSFTMNLAPGWNLVTIPLVNHGYKASTLGLMDGDEVRRWDTTTQTYDKEYTVGVSGPSSDFFIQPSCSYWIHTDTAQSLVLYGEEATDTQSIYIDVPEGGGWACVGLVSLDTALWASDVVDMYSGTLSSVSKWDSNTQTYLGYLAEYGIGDFALSPGDGLLVYVEDDGTLSYEP